MKGLFIGIDRDGTIIHDNKYHLGRTDDWKSKIKTLDTVVEGIKKIYNNLPRAKIYMMTNQAGVAVKDFPKLTKGRAIEVCEEVMLRLGNNGAKLDGYILCHYAPPQYVKTHPQYSFDENLVKHATCFKPNPGMIYGALKKENLAEKETSIYFIGDRVSDVKAALNAKGTGILIPFEKEPGQEDKVKALKNKKAIIVKNFLEAAEFIVKIES